MDEAGTTTNRDRSAAPPSRRWRLAPTAGDLLAGFVGLFLVTLVTVGPKLQHVLSVGAVVLLLLIGGRARGFVLHFWPVPVMGIVYDVSRIVAVYGERVHVADLYHAELCWFGVPTAAGIETIPEWLAAHASPWLDLVCGAAYLIYIYVPIGLAVALYFVDQRRMAWITWGLLGSTLLGIAVYVAFPAAPPWYVAQHGLGAALGEVAPDPAGASRFDALLGTGYFRGFYAHSAHVFGAVPSLHVGYVAMGYLGVRGLGARWELPLLLLLLLVAFSALYLQHHWVIDILAGLGCALLAHGLVRAAERWACVSKGSAQ